MDILTQGGSVVKPEFPSDNPTQNMLVATYERGGSKHAMYLAALAIELERSPTTFFKTEIRKLTGVSERTADSIVEFFRLLEQGCVCTFPQKSAHGWVPSISTSSSSKDPTNHEQISAGPELVRTALNSLKLLGWGKRKDGYMCYSDAQIVEYIQEHGAGNVLYAIQATNEPGIHNRCAVVRTNLRNGLCAPPGWDYSPTLIPEPVIGFDQPFGTTSSLPTTATPLVDKQTLSTSGGMNRESSETLTPQRIAATEEKCSVNRKLGPYASGLIEVETSDRDRQMSGKHPAKRERPREVAGDTVHSLRTRAIGSQEESLALTADSVKQEDSKASHGARVFHSQLNAAETDAHEDPYFARELSRLLRSKMCDRSYMNWFESVTWIITEGKRVICLCGSVIHADWIAEHYTEIVSGVLAELGVSVPEILFRPIETYS